MSVRSWYHAGLGYVRDGFFYVKHKLTGSSYGLYYADRMDRIIRRNPAWGLNLNKRFQLEYLMAHGLKPESNMLDYGCGALAAGLHFIDYLQPGKYVGVDISLEALNEGQRRITSRGLANKNPTLFQIRPGSLEAINGKKFDVIWAQSVFTHMPPDDIDALLAALKPYIRGSSRFYATFARTTERIHQERFKDWYYTVGFFRSLAEKHAFRMELMTDWLHPDDPAGTDTLVSFSEGRT